MKFNMKTLCSIGALLLCSESVLAKGCALHVKKTYSNNRLKELRINGNFNESALQDFSQFISDKNDLERLVLSDINLTELPSEVYNLKNLKELVIVGSDISNLSEKIGNLKNLKELIVRSSKLTELPDEVSNLEDLKYLDVANNKINSFPLWIGNLRNLEHLDICWNPALMSQDRWIKRENWLQDQESREINRAILGLHSLRYLVLTGKNGGLYDYSNYMKEIRSEGVAAFEAEKEAAKAEAERQRIAQEKAIAAENEIIESATQMFEEAEREAMENEAIESATQMFEEAEKEAAKAEAERQRIAQEKAEREAAQAASQVIARESYYSKFGQFFKSMWSRFTDSRLGRFLKTIGQTLFSNR